ncbi:MAG: hypothetical protein P0S95_00570, partial [Rhabdochlamydiaceae bacterium]|nr:hypothetical protein [Candidatus Amphrikana amoebophyrae]
SAHIEKLLAIINSAENKDQVNAYLHNLANLIVKLSSSDSYIAHINSLLEDSSETLAASQALHEQIIGEIFLPILGPFVDYNIEMINSLKDSTRAIQALCTYCSLIGTDHVLTPCLKDFVQSVATKRFSDARFETEKNAHLAKFKTINPEKFADWKSLQGTHKMVEGAKVTISDNWEDYLVMGTEVENSCQHVESAQRNGMGLLDSCMNGANYLLVIHDGEGKIATRAILKQVFVNNAPALVLFQPFAQNTFLKAQNKDEIAHAARLYAQELEMPLYGGSSQYDQSKPCVAVKAHCETGRSPIIYEDVKHTLQAQPFDMEVRYQFPPL